MRQKIFLMSNIEILYNFQVILFVHMQYVHIYFSFILSVFSYPSTTQILDPTPA